MHTQNPLMDEIARLTTAAMGLAHAAGDEAKTAFRAQGDRFIAEFDLVRRDEFEALKAELAAVRAELAALSATKSAPEKPASKPRARPASPEPKTPL